MRRGRTRSKRPTRWIVPELVPTASSVSLASTAMEVSGRAANESVRSRSPVESDQTCIAMHHVRLRYSHENES